MTWDNARVVLSAITDATDDDAKLEKLTRQLLHASVHYAHLRARWKLADLAERRELDQERTLAHETVIDATNILSRAMAAQGLDIEWRRTLGDDRREIGDFACYCAAMLGLAAR